MPRLDRLKFRRALTAGAACVLATLSCGREVTGPPEGLRIARGFTFEARFGPEGLPNGVASDLVPFTRVRVVLVNAAGSRVVDRVVDFPSNVEEVPLSLDVPLAAGSGSEGESMSLSLAFVNAEGDTVFRGGPLQVQVVPTAPGSEPPPVPQIPVTFTGTGAAATSVVISRGADTLLAGSAFSYSAVALDAQGSPIAGTPIAWRSASPTRATITASGAGAGTTLASRGPALIIAQLLSPGAPADTVLLEVLPRAGALVAVSGSGQSALVGTALSQPVVVRVNATDGLPMVGVPVGFAAGNGGSVGTPNAVSDASGLVQSAWTLGAGAGAQTLTATATGLVGSPLAFTATATAPQLVFTVAPSNAVQNVAIAPAVVVTATDGLGNTVTGFTGAVTLSFGSNPGGGTLAGTTTVNAVAGVATFADLSVNVAAAGYTLAASAPGLSSVTSPAFSISAGTATTLDFTQQPTSAVAGVPFTPAVVVTARDGSGNIASGFTGMVTLGIWNGLGTLGGTLVVNAVAGVATFANAQALNTNSALRLLATATGLAPDTSLSLTVVPNAPLELRFDRQPSNVIVGQPIAPAVTVYAVDAFGNTTPTFAGAVTIALGNNPGGATLTGTTTVSPVLDASTFSDLRVSSAGVGYTLTASVPGLTSVTSASFDVSLAPATQLAFTVQPSGSLAGQSITPAVVVTALDALGNVATGYTGTVTLALASNPGGSTLSGTVAVPAVAGVATFSGLSLNNPGAGYSLGASAPGLTGTNSAPFSVTASVFANAWTNAAGGTWSTAANWSLGRVPIAADTVVISLSGTYTVTMDVNYSGSTMLVGGGTGTQTLAVGVRTLTVANLLSVQPTGAVTLSGAGTIAGVGTVSNQGTVTMSAGTLSAGLVNNGRLVLLGTTTVNGSVTTGLTSVIEVRGASGTSTANATITNGFTNTGLIELTDINGGFGASLTVTTGSLVNAATGTITSLVGAGGARTLAAVLDNQGTVLLPSALTLSRAGAAHVNAGTINVTGGGLTVNQSGGGASFTNAGPGTIAVSAGRTVTVSGGTLDLSTGLMSGTSGALVTNSVTPLLFSTTTVEPRLTLNATTIPGTYTIPAGDSLVLVSGSPTLTLVNNGRLVLLGTTTVNGSVTTGLTSVIEVRGASGTSTANATITNGFTNTGLIELTDINGGFGASLTVTTGSLVNAATGTITSLVGAGGARTLAAVLDNQGTVLLPSALTLSRAGAAHVNAGTINVTGGGLTVNQSGGGASFTNAGPGTIAVSAGRTVTVSGGTLDLSTGLMSGTSGALVTNSVTPLLFSTTTVEPRLTLNATTIPGTYTIPAGDSLVLVSGSPTLTLVNNGRLVLLGTTTVNGSVTTGLTSVIEVRGASGTSTANATITNGFTNTGLIELTDINGGFGASLTVTTGSLVNAATGTITSLVGAGGARTLAAVLDNQGTVLLPSALTLSRAGAAHVNAGTINVTGGGLTVNQSGGGASFTNAGPGTIAVSAGRTVTVSGGTLDLSTGLMSGTSGALVTNSVTPLLFSTTTVEPRLTLNATTIPGTYTIPAGDSLVLVSGSPTLTLVNNGRLVLLGTTTVNGSVTTGLTSVIEVRGASGTSTANATITNGFTNTGLIELTDINGGFGASLTVTTGSLVNAATGTITSLVGAGGARTLAAVLDNQGTVLLPSALTLSRAGAAHVNAGTINVTGGGLTVNQSGGGASFTNAGPGTIAVSAGRTVTVSGGTLDLSTGLMSGTSGALVTNSVTPLLFSTTTVEPRLTLNATTIPGTYTIPAGDSLVLVSGSPTLTLVNNGRLVLLGTTTVNGSVTTGLTSVIEVRGASGTSTANATITNGFTNTGLIELTDINGGFGASLTVTTGSLVNAATGTITSLVGAGGARTLAAVLDNQGTVLLPSALTLSRAGAAHVNAGTINVTGGGLTVNQSGGGASFTNAGPGTIAVSAGRTVTVSGGTLDLSTGLMSGTSGALVTNSVTPLLFSTTTVEPRLTLNATTIPGTYTIPAGDSLVLVSGSPTLTLVNNGRLVLLGTTTVNGSVTTGLTSVIEVRGASGTSTANATITNGFTNTGLIELTDINGGFGASLTVTTGSLVNAATGTITSLVGAGGARTLAAVLDNQGTVLLPSALTLSRAGAAHVNAGTINVTGGGLTVNQSGGGASFTNAGPGTIAVSAGRTVTVSGGTLDLSTGLMSGTSGALVTNSVTPLLFSTTTVEPRLTLNATTIPGTYTIPAGDSLVLVSGSPTLTLVNNGRLVLLGTTTVNGSVTTGLTSVIEVRGASGTSTANATITNGFTNTGLIELTDINGGFGASLTVTTGSLVNAATGTITSLVGAGGARTLAASLLDNFGTLNVLQSLSANTAINQRGIATVGATRTLTVSGLLQLFGGSTTTVNGTLVRNGGCTNAGGTIVGGGTYSACP